MHNILKHKFCLFLFVAAFLFAACSFLDNSIQTPTSGSVTFQINGSKNRTAVNKTASDSSINLEDGSILEVALKGSYEAVQTTVVKNNTASLSFAEIPVGTRLWAEASIYKTLEGNNKQILFTGKSAEVTITAGENPLSIKMTQYNTSSESSDSPSNPNAPENQGDSGNTGSSSGSEDPNSTSGQNGSTDPNGTGDPNGSSEPQEPEIIYIDIYVSASGNDTTGDGLTLDTAFKTINRACDYIVDNGTSDDNWKILVSGNCNPTEPTIIPEELTTDHAKSILIDGATGVDGDGIPQDVLDRGKAGSVNGVTDGDVLRINSTVPVTITNLKITGGYGGGTKAGGLTVSQGAVVSLGNGALITGNRNPSNGRGGGIHNEGTLFMYGTAVVGDKTNGGKTSESSYVCAMDSSSYNDFNNHKMSNYASTGGGIFNGKTTNDNTVAAKLYLGYKRSADGTPVQQELTGGVYYSSGTNGGAIYNTGESSVYFSSGIIRWCGSSQYGAGIFNEANAYLEMSGGEISKDSVSGNSAANGGGVYNEGPGKFVFSGGTIKENEALSASGGSGHGAGVWNGGYMFMYGTAVIGDKDATSSELTTDFHGNKAGSGGGIYNDGEQFGSIDVAQRGRLYIGYRPDSDGTTPVRADSFTGGIYHNYSCTVSTSETYGGGAIWSSGVLKIDSGTIAYNVSEKCGGAIHSKHNNNTEFAISGGVIHDNKVISSAEGKGGAVYMQNGSSHTLQLNGTVSIPAGSDGKHDIYLQGSSTRPMISVGGPLTISEMIRVTPGEYSESYSTILVLPDGVTDTTITKEAGKFTITPQIDSNDPTVPPVIYKVKSYGANSGILSKLEVGDIVFNDGTAVAYHNDLSLSAAQKAKAIAVIYNTAYYDSSYTPHTLGVSLKQQTNLAWCSGTAKAASTNINTIVCREPNYSLGGYQSTDYVVGSNALSAISTYLTEHDPYISDTAAVTLADNYPAFNFAENFSGISGNNVYGTDFSSGWYLPTPKEFTLICDNSSTVIDAFGKCGAAFYENTYYWTCAQYTAASQADLIKFPSGDFSAETKSSLHNVLAIREF